MIGEIVRNLKTLERIKQVLSLEQLAGRGHTKLIEQVGKDNISTDKLKSMMNSAALCGRVETMKLLKAWGARAFNDSLAKAALGGSITAMKLLKEWGATDWDMALASAARGCHLEVIKLLKEWGSTNWDFALSEAALNGHITAMKMLKNGELKILIGHRLVRLWAVI